MRADFLAHECEGDLELRREVEQLLDYDMTEKGPLDRVVRLPHASSNERDGVTFTRVDPGGPDIPVSPLPPDLLQRAVRRLRLVGLLLPVTLIATWLIPVTVGGDLLLEFGQLLQWVFPVSVIVSSLAIVWATSSTMPPAKVLDIGLVYQVVVAYALTSAQYWGTFTDLPATVFQPDIIGYSGVAVWMLLYSVIIPTRPRRALPALLLSATAPFVTYLLTIRYDRAPVLEAGPFFYTLILPYLVTVGFAYLATRIIYGLGREVSKAREFGSYRLEEQLGQGGMGEVWRASHRLLARPAAVKLIRPGAIGNDPTAVDTAIRRFEREAQVTASLRSTHTVELYDFGAAADGSLYYVMELLDGIDLEQMVRRFGPLEPARVIHLTQQACLSLAEAHGLELIHRDIKPANLHLCRLGTEYDVLKVLDFGLVRRSSPDPRDSTTVPLVAGTPAFMPPEVAMGDDADCRADLYSLGCVMYWMLTGHQVFQAASIAEMLAAHVQRDPEPPSVWVDTVPISLDQVVLKCLQKDRQERFATASELNTALEKLRIEPLWSQANAAAWWRKHRPDSRRVKSSSPKLGVDPVKD